MSNSLRKKKSELIANEVRFKCLWTICKETKKRIFEIYLRSNSYLDFFGHLALIVKWIISGLKGRKVCCQFWSRLSKTRNLSFVENGGNRPRRSGRRGINQAGGFSTSALKYKTRCWPKFPNIAKTVRKNIYYHCTYSEK